MGASGLIKDPNPGTTTDGSIIRTDQHNLITDILDGKHATNRQNLVLKRVTSTVNYTVVEADFFVEMDATSNNLTVDLPSASTSGIKNKLLAIKKIDSSSNTVTIDPNSAEKIDGASTLVLTLQNQTAIIMSDGTNWKLLANFKKITNSDLISGIFSNITGIGTQAQNLDMNSNLITNLATPVSANDAATKQYVDNLVQGLDVKNSVRAATTANITLSGTQTIDGVSVVANDRVLVKNQTTASENGIYVVASGAWSRATDADSNSEVTSGMYCWVTEGTTNGDQGFILTTDDPITLGTTALTFTQFSGAGQITAGNGLSKSGNTLSINTSITADLTTAQTLDSKTLTTTKRIANDITSLTYSATTDLDFNDNELKTLSLTGNVTFTTSNRGAGKKKVVIITCDSSNRTITFATGWKSNATSPVTITANKTGILSLQCTNANDSGIIAIWKELL